MPTLSPKAADQRKRLDRFLSEAFPEQSRSQIQKWIEEHQVLLDGKPVCSCLVLAASVNGRHVLTIEGLKGEDGELHPVQQAFIEGGAIQCGYCTPGMILTVKALLDENPNPTREDVITAIAGNLCRCTGYTKIIDAALKAAERIRR